MQATDQTTFSEGLGNCFSACVASVLEVPLEEVPFFGADELWWTRFSEWLEARNLYAICFKHRLGRAPVGYHILSGKSPRGEFLHSVVAKGEDIVHDPHPSRANILDRVDCIIIVPMDVGNHKRELTALRKRVAELEDNNEAQEQRIERRDVKIAELEQYATQGRIDSATIITYAQLNREFDVECRLLRERVAKLEGLGPWIEANRLAQLQWADDADARGDVNRAAQRATFEARADAFKQCGYELNNRAGKDLRGHGQ